MGGASRARSRLVNRPRVVSPAWACPTLKEHCSAPQSVAGGHCQPQMPPPPDGIQLAAMLQTQMPCTTCMGKVISLVPRGPCLRPPVPDIVSERPVPRNGRGARRERAARRVSFLGAVNQSVRPLCE